MGIPVASYPTTFIFSLLSLIIIPNNKNEIIHTNNNKNNNNKLCNSTQQNKHSAGMLYVVFVLLVVDAERDLTLILQTTLTHFYIFHKHTHNSFNVQRWDACKYSTMLSHEHWKPKGIFQFSLFSWKLNKSLVIKSETFTKNVSKELKD